MPSIDDYALIGDTHSAALVSRAGSMDWLCLPRFDSGACFAAILDREKGGHWRIAPHGDVTSATRSYRGDTMVLETTFETPTGTAKLVDCLALEEGSDPHAPRRVLPEEVIVRVVEGLSGRVAMEMDYCPRFDYGDVVPWFRKSHGAVEAVGGPDALDLVAGVELEQGDARLTSSFEVAAGDSVSFLASYHLSHIDRPSRAPEECMKLIARTEAFWRDWAQRCSYEGRWRDQVVRSLLVLKSLTFSPSGGVVAAPTTSLPEQIGGPRNWDYRYCWLRDATFTLDVLLDHGFSNEAVEWRDWLLRGVAGDPEDIQIMYGVLGERRLEEITLDWLSGYRGSSPVRIGNAATQQFQLDVYGEVLDSFHEARRTGIETPPEAWEIERVMVDFVCDHWQEPDEGIWEVRSGRQHFVHSKVMAWVALDRAVKAIEKFGKEGPLEDWKKTRDEIRRQIFDKGVSATRGCFVRAYDDDTEVDGSLLMLPLVGFCEAHDAVMLATIDAIQEDLMVDGLVLRYRTDKVDDGLPPGEGTFLMCTFWLVDCLVLLGRLAEAEELFERLLGICNDVGLLSEQYHAENNTFLGNFPQAFSHVALVTSAVSLETAGSNRAVKRGR